MTDRHGWQAELETRRSPHLVEGGDRLVLLGTAGGGAPKATRCGFANAIVVGDTAYLIDAGEGVHAQLWRAGLAATDRFGRGRPLIRSVFITHLHADHIMDLPNIFQGSWPSSPIDVYGPGPAREPYTSYDDPVHPLRFPEDPAPGIDGVLDHFHRAFALNINARIIAERRADFLGHVRVHEIEAPVSVERPGPHFEIPDMDPFVVRPVDDHGVSVSAVLVQHAPVFPAFAYRFDTPNGSVVFSGDTGPCDNVVRLASGADYLVHEVIDLPAVLARFADLPNAAEVERQLSRSHTPVRQVGALAQRADVGTLVLSHLVPGEGSHSPEEWEALAQTGFDGRVVCGVDLDELPLPAA